MRVKRPSNACNLAMRVTRRNAAAHQARGLKWKRKKDKQTCGNAAHQARGLNCKKKNMIISGVRHELPKKKYYNNRRACLA